MQSSTNIILATRTFDTPPQFPWHDPPGVLKLTNRDVHVWRLGLDVSDDIARRFENSLSSDERARSDRFRFAHDRRRFVVRRGVLRVLLGWYLGLRPDQLRMEYNPYGKPALSGQASQRSIQFNLTHSGELALIAVTLGRKVGVDVERLNPSVDELEIAERFFSQREITTLRGLFGPVRTEAFFRCWTRKEAYLKARGMGLTCFLDHLDEYVPCGHGAPVNVWDDPAELPGWSIQDLCPTLGHVAALVVEN